MLQQLINHNSDIKDLHSKGFDIEVLGGQFLLVHQVPYINRQKQIKKGTLVCVLTLSNPKTLSKPKDHTIHFIGETPCDFNGNPLKGLINNSNKRKLSQDITVNHFFSSKPITGNYKNYYDKVNTYVKILSSQVDELKRQNYV